MTEVIVGQNTTVSLNVSNDSIVLSTGDSVSVDGEGNVVNSESNDLVTVSGTDGSFDTIYVNNDTSTGATFSGAAPGVLLLIDTQAWVAGSNNDVALQAGDSLGAYGGGNVITATATDLVALGSTGGDFDTVYVNNDLSSATASNSQVAGVSLSSNTQAWVAGSNNDVALQAGDSLAGWR